MTNNKVEGRLGGYEAAQSTNGADGLNDAHDCAINSYAPLGYIAFRSRHGEQYIRLDDSEVLTALLGNKWLTVADIAEILSMDSVLVEKSLGRLVSKGIVEVDAQAKTYYRRMQK